MEMNKTVHIALVGGQTMPIYMCLRESKAEKVVLIHSSSTKRRAEKIQSDLMSESSQRSFELIDLEPLDYEVIKERVSVILDAYSQWDVEVNLTSGTKPWTIAFSVLSAKYDNVQLYYSDQNNVIYNYNTCEKHSSMELSIAEILKYNQTDVRSYVPLCEYTEADKLVLQQVKSIRKWYRDIFNNLANPRARNVEFEKTEGVISDLDNYSEMMWNKKYYVPGDETALQYIRFFLTDKYGSNEKFELCSPHAFDIVTFSGWFEYEVALMLSKWKDCEEVWMNVIFPYDNRNPKNEIDVIAMIGNKLLFVECKIQVFDNTDIDKFTSAVKNYGGMGSKAIFITQQRMKKEAKEKCNTNEIDFFSFCDDPNRMKGDNEKELRNKLRRIMQISNPR